MPFTERRHLQYMQNHLSAFARGAIPLPDLISTLEMLFEHLQHQNPTWTSSFRGHLVSLEVLYATASDEDRPLTPSEQSALKSKAEALSLLVESALNGEDEDP